MEGWRDETNVDIEIGARVGDCSRFFVSSDSWAWSDGRVGMSGIAGE